jgi:hypothetical protein
MQGRRRADGLVSRIVERLSESYLKQTDLRLHRITQTTANDATWLLYVIRDGSEAGEKRRQPIDPREENGPRGFNSKPLPDIALSFFRMAQIGRV